MQTEGRNTQCKFLREDYKECLHHKKKGSRAEAITSEMERREAAGTLPEGVRDLLTKDFKTGIPK